MISEIRHDRIDVGRLSLHVASAGSGRIVILLHGFPEFWFTWRNQVDALVDAGFAAVMPDLPGYNLSDKPKGVGAYAPARICADIEALIRAVAGDEPVALVGHDWGAAIGWQILERRRTRLSHFAALSVPHPASVIRAALTSPRQLLNFSYQYFFQIPALPERLLRAREFAVLRTFLPRVAVRHDAFTADDLELYVEAWSRPGALRAAVNYYRALYRTNPFRSATGGAASGAFPRAMLIWGENDHIFIRRAVEGSRRHVPALDIVYVPEAGHFVHLDNPPAVNDLLIGFLRTDAAR